MSLDVAGFVGALVLSGAAAFALAASLHRWLGGGRRRDAAAVGAVSAVLASTAWGAIPISVAWSLGAFLPPRTALWAAALGAVVLAVRTGGAAARAAGGVAGALTALAVVSALQSGWPLLLSYLPAPTSRAAEVSPPSLTAEARPSAPTTPEHRAGPTFGELCHPDELGTVATTPVPGGNDVAVTIATTNVGDRQCHVEGWPSSSLLSGGVSLALNVHVAETQPGGDHVEAAKVWLAPGFTAQTQVWWPPWGAAADLDATQRLEVGVGGGLESVDLAEADRWDVVRRAEVWVAPWQPAEPTG